ncbi:hypothetical protein STCU_02087 [Strigomonas culicis]|uniref:Amino acid transporter transmembrane domain-containing protein n=1 Tax=Strigomonas culicis TaxID=28005 RepID=S9UY72_9TRYP|nr:hypothetical protein STCU_02087 [Strigomonas culicis]|eukprot:EPY33679.1 hypothetical protein STCU_02087 [Strigomonas culicis]
MDQSYLDNIPLHWHLLIISAIGAVTLLLGLFIPAINTVFNFAGSICGSFLSFINPALFVMYAGDFTRKKVGLFMWLTAHLLLVIGVTALVFGTGATIYSVVSGA